MSSLDAINRWRQKHPQVWAQRTSLACRTCGAPVAVHCRKLDGSGPSTTTHIARLEDVYRQLGLASLPGME